MSIKTTIKTCVDRQLQKSVLVSKLCIYFPEGDSTDTEKKMATKAKQSLSGFVKTLAKSKGNKKLVDEIGNVYFTLILNNNQLFVLLDEYKSPDDESDNDSDANELETKVNEGKTKGMFL
jgi:hypothetical protein